MAHDFFIKNSKKSKKGVFFHGFANGLMYRAFQEQKHNAGSSGDSGIEYKTKDETMKALNWAISVFDKMQYADANGMDKIKKFFAAMANDPSTDTYLIWFS